MKIKNTQIIIFIWISINCLFINQVKSQYAIAGTQGAIYVDIVPDTLLNPQPGNIQVYYIDINQDGANDIKILAYSQSPARGINIFSLNSFTRFSFGNTNTQCASYPMLKEYSIGDTINGGNYIANGSLGGYYFDSIASSCSIPAWINGSDIFFGVKYKTATDTSFGWVKLNITDASKVLIKEFSLGIPLNGIEEFSIGSQINIYPNPASNMLQVASGNSKIQGVSLHDVLGNKVMTRKENNIDVSNLNEGVYFMQIKTSEVILTKKIIIQR